MADPILDIRRALEKRLAGVSGIPDIAWENAEFDPTDKNQWVRCVLSPLAQRPSAVGVGVKIRHQGLFLIDVFVRQNKTLAGTKTVDELAQDIQDAFSYGTILTENGNQIRVRFSERNQGLQDDPWYFVPIRVEWYSYI